MTTEIKTEANNNQNGETFAIEVEAENLYDFFKNAPREKPSAEWTQNVAETIRSQISTELFWASGARDYQAVINDKNDPGLMFGIKGTSAFPHRVADVSITLNGLDYYDIKITMRASKKEAYTTTDIDCFMLEEVLYRAFETEEYIKTVEEIQARRAELL